MGLIIDSDSVVQLIIRNGEEESRKGSVDFRTAELAYTLDTKRLFIGDIPFTSENNYEITTGGVISGNKYLGYIDSNNSISFNDYNFEDFLTEDSPYRSHYELQDNELIKTKDKKWFKESYYNKNYDAYDGDFMYDIHKNAFILFDHNISASKNPDGIRYRSNTQNYSSDTNLQTIGDGYIILRNIIPDGVSIIFDNNEDQNVLKVGNISLESLPNNLAGEGLRLTKNKNISLDIQEYTDVNSSDNYVVLISSQDGNSIFKSDVNLNSLKNISELLARISNGDINVNNVVSALRGSVGEDITAIQSWVLFDENKSNNTIIDVIKDTIGLNSDLSTLESDIKQSKEDIRGCNNTISNVNNDLQLTKNLLNTHIENTNEYENKITNLEKYESLTLKLNNEIYRDKSITKPFSAYNIKCLAGDDSPSNNLIFEDNIDAKIGYFSSLTIPEDKQAVSAIIGINKNLSVSEPECILERVTDITSKAIDSGDENPWYSVTFYGKYKDNSKIFKASGLCKLTGDDENGYTSVGNSTITLLECKNTRNSDETYDSLLPMPPFSKLILNIETIKPDTDYFSNEEEIQILLKTDSFSNIPLLRIDRDLGIIEEIRDDNNSVKFASGYETILEYCIPENGISALPISLYSNEDSNKYFISSPNNIDNLMITPYVNANLSSLL